METETLDKLANAKASAKATYENIKELVEANYNSNGNDEDMVNAIQEHPLSVEVRSGWYHLGSDSLGTKPAEYRILISTGGPAVQVTGELNEYGEPETATIQCQDWFQPWTPVHWSDLGTNLEPSQVDEILLAYARCFYFGE